MILKEATMTAETSGALGAIGQIAMLVDDLEESVRFYSEVLGIPLLFRAPPGLAFFDCGGVRLMLSQSEEGQSSGSATTIYFRVPDIHAAYRALGERGAVFNDDPHLIAQLADHDLWMAFLRDPSGNQLALMSEVPR
jgi:methylmalonyl-CoA/ethylmalonyl-CoA epimerase